MIEKVTDPNKIVTDPVLLNIDSGSGNNPELSCMEDVITPQDYPELVDKRTENSKTYSLGNRRYRSVVSIGAVHWAEDYSRPVWQDIDPTPDELGNITKAPYTLIHNGESYTFTDRKTGDSVTLKPSLIGDIAAKPGDIQLMTFPEGVKFQRTINEGDSLTAEFDISITGKSVRLVTSAVDADGYIVPLTVEVKDGKLIETVRTLEASTFDGKAKAVRYPITADPTLTVSLPSKDSRLNQGYPATPFGDDRLCVSIISTNIQHTLLEFPVDWGTDIPAGATINAATLYLYAYSINSSAGRTYDVYRLTRTDWVELEATWNIYKTGSNWTTAGGDYTDLDDSDTVPASAGWMSWAVETIAGYAQTNSINLEFLIKDNDETAAVKYTLFYGEDEATETTLRPYVEIDYTSVVAPTVTTAACTDVAPTSVTGNGNITATGGENCTRRGFCYLQGSSGDPDTTDSVAYDDGDFGTGAFSKSITGLTADTAYRVRAYAVNSAGTSYGTTVDVTTDAYDTSPVVKIMQQMNQFNGGAL